MTLAACTIVSNNYLPFARVFVRSFREHNPDGEAYVLVVDRRHPKIDYGAEPFVVVFADELGIPAFSTFAFRYSILELNTAVKPYFLEHLHVRYGLQRVCYFDPDILVTAELAELYEALASADVVLTPHILEPLRDSRSPGDRDFLVSGAYNLGFLGFSFHEGTAGFLRWWQEKLYTDCLHRVDLGLFVDQKWMDLAPAFLERALILRDPAYNVAYWNLLSRRLSRRDGKWQVGEAKLRFFHFSGFDPLEPQKVSKYQDRYVLQDRPDAVPLFEEYRELLLAAGYEEMRGIPYGYGSFLNGEPVSLFARQALDKIDQDGRRWSDPFAVGEGSFYRWLREPVRAERKIFLPRLAIALWEARGDLQSVYPDPETTDYMSFVRWFVKAGHKGESGLTEEMIAPTESSLAWAAQQREVLRAGGSLWFDNGVPVPLVAGRVLDLHDPDAERWTEFLTTDLEESFFLWLLEDFGGDSPIYLPRLALLIWEDEEREDLRRTFPDPAADLLSFATWLVLFGAREAGLSETFVVATRRSLEDFYLRHFAAWFNGRLSCEESGRLLAGLTPQQREWLWQPAATSAASSLPLFAMKIYEGRLDLQQAYPDPLGRDRAAFSYWLLAFGRRDYALPADFCATLHENVPRHKRWTAVLRSWRSRFGPTRPGPQVPEVPEEPAAPVTSVEEEPEETGGEDVEARLRALHGTWEALAQTDPLWAILSEDDKRRGRWDHEEFFRTGEKEVADVLARVERLDTDLLPKAALDFGCGAGRLTRAFAGRFDRVFGIDISETMITLAKRSSPEPNVEYYLNQRDDLSFLPDNSFNFLYTGRVLQHMPPEAARSYIQDFFRVLVPGGLAVFQVPSEVRGDPVNDALADEAYRAEIVVLEAPQSLPAGAHAEIEVEVRNASDHRWPSVEEVGVCQIRLANQWLTPEGDLRVEDDGRTALGKALGGGESRRLRLVVGAPTEPGSYLLRFDLVQELVTWFAARGSATVSLPMLVEAGETRGTAGEASPHTEIEMHVLPRSEIEALIEAAGGELLEAEADDLAGPEWISYRYFAVKSELMRPYLHQHPRTLLLPIVRPRHAGWEDLLAVQAGMEPLNHYGHMLWLGNHHLRRLFPSTTPADRQRCAAWLHLYAARELDFQSWLLPPIDWRWFDEPSEEIAGEEQGQISNFLHLVWCLRPQLQDSYRLDEPEGRRGLLRWATLKMDLEFSAERALVRERLAEAQDPAAKAPPPAVPEPLGGFGPGVNVVEHPAATLGIREDARMSLLALDAAGVPATAAMIRNAEASAAQVEQEFRYKANLIHFNADLMPLVAGQLGPQALGGRYNIAYCLWELPYLPPQWAAGLSLVDEVWVPSRYVYDCFARQSPVPVVHLPYAVTAEPEASLTRKDFDLPLSSFLFLTSFDKTSFITRKNPWAAIEAFQRAFPKDRGDVGLVVKCTYFGEADPHWSQLRERAAEDYRIYLVNELMDRERVLALVRLCDAYVSLHRSEGFGRGPAEAMLLGKPAIVTDFSGSTDFATSETAFPVKARLVPVGMSDYPFPLGQVWADPDVDHAAGHMERVVEDEALRRRIALAGRRFIRSTYSPAAAGRRFAERLRLLGLL